MERWRWLPDRPPPRHAVVNIPAFRLYAFEDDSVARRPAMAANVIVGEARGRHNTPMFSATLREIVFRPYWEVPPRIARNELVPIMRRNPTYFHAEGFEIVRGYDDAAATYPPTAANLARVTAGTLRLRQRPGPENALGLVKFVFPNRFNVYLHDTPAKELFDRARRDFSHGCIRLQSPAAFAEFVLSGQEPWTHEAIDSAMHGDRTLRVKVDRPVVVYVVYATAAADDTGVAYFYDDLYGHDARLATLLGAAP
jgi:murein L,D-transpeptidase YcbB/YkuD